MTNGLNKPYLRAPGVTCPLTSAEFAYLKEHRDEIPHHLREEFENTLEWERRFLGAKTMTILEIEQGHYGDLTGMTRDEAVVMFAGDAEAFLEKHPSARRYHRTCWVELKVADTRTAPWGYVWYVIDADGLLKMHSAQYDSSG
jgi:hypothetical protein